MRRPILSEPYFNAFYVAWSAHGGRNLYGYAYTWNWRIPS